MNSKHLIALLLLYFTKSLTGIGQNFVINGGTFYAGPNAVAQSNGGVWVQGNAVVDLNGDFTITKNATSPEPGNFRILNNANVNHTGHLYIEQDLWCDGSFVNNQSTVELFGNANQIIGSNILPTISFHNLTLSGTGSLREKELLNVDAEIAASGVLNLSDRILNTNAQLFHVLNGSANAIVNSDLGNGFGYIASDVGGYLRWKSVSGSFYFAPLGSVIPMDLYRPISYTTFGSDFYKMRLDQHDATSDGFPLVNHSPEICQANSKFYHHFRAENGSVASFNISFLPAVDGTWTGLAEYIQQWESTGNNAANNNAGFEWLNVDSNSYDQTEEAFVLTNPGPVANFSFASQDLFNTQIQFTDNSSGASQWEWNFNDGTYESSINPFHVFGEGDFEVLLTVTNSFGCTDTATAFIHSGGELIIPNIFSPDADGVNDFYEVQLPKVEEYHLMVFNRWGSLLFESNDPEMLWDGQYEGEACAEGTYFSVLSIKQGNYQEQLDGTIQLVRKQ
jgi:gliding motility-associated-like protein